MHLLERVVQKLAIIADLQTARNCPQTTEDMNNEDIGILSMMHGKNIVEEKERQDRRTVSVLRRRTGPPPSTRLEDLGVPPEAYQSWSFNCLRLSQEQRKKLAEFAIVSRSHEAGEGLFQTQEEVQVL